MCFFNMRLTFISIKNSFSLHTLDFYSKKCPLNQIQKNLIFCQEKNVFSKFKPEIMLFKNRK